MANFASHCLFAYPVIHIKFLKSCFHSLALTICIYDVCIVGEMLLTGLWFQTASLIQQDLFSNFILQSNYLSFQVFYRPILYVYSFHHGWYQQSSIRAQNRATDACVDVFSSFARKWLVIVPESSFSDSPAPGLCGFMLTYISAVCLGACRGIYWEHDWSQGRSHPILSL